MFSIVQRVDIAVEAGPVPEWSGEFVEMNDGMAIMRVHANDTRQHVAPLGWVAIGHDTFHDGTFEVYVYFKMRLA